MKASEIKDEKREGEELENSEPKRLRKDDQDHRKSQEEIIQDLKKQVADFKSNSNYWERKACKYKNHLNYLQKYRNAPRTIVINEEIFENELKNFLGEVEKKYKSDSKGCFKEIQDKFHFLIKNSINFNEYIKPISNIILEFIESKEIQAIINDKPENKYKLVKAIEDEVQLMFEYMDQEGLEFPEAHKEYNKKLNDFIKEANNEKHKSYRERIKENTPCIPSRVLANLGFYEAREWAKGIKAEQKMRQSSDTQGF